MNEAALWWGLLFASVGLGYFIYGKQQKAPVPLLCGIGLMVFPYVVGSNWLMVLLGAALMAVPFLFRP